MSLLRGVCVATFVFTFNALVLDSDRAFAQAAPAAQAAGPRFRPDGPNADAWGQKEGYPSCIEYVDRLHCRVGASLATTRCFLRAPSRRRNNPSRWRAQRANPSFAIASTGSS